MVYLDTIWQHWSKKNCKIRKKKKVFLDTLLCIYNQPNANPIPGSGMFPGPLKNSRGVLISAQTGCDSLLYGVSWAISWKFKFTPQLNIRRGSWMQENKTFILVSSLTDLLVLLGLNSRVTNVLASTNISSWYQLLAAPGWGYLFLFAEGWSSLPPNPSITRLTNKGKVVFSYISQINSRITIFIAPSPIIIRLPTTYDNHPSHPSNPIPSRLSPHIAVKTTSPLKI